VTAISGTPITKTGWMASASCCGPAPVGRPALRIAPITDTPIVPPIERENCTALVAAPRWRVGTPFWTTSARFCSSRPRPSPVTTIATVACERGDPAVMVASRTKPAPMITGPAISAHR
jgi:hypothetical protein